MESSAKRFNPIRPMSDRNDRCPCESGKKYKKCCMQKDQESAAQIIKTSSQIPTLAAQSTVVSNSVPIYPWLKRNFPGVGKYCPKETTSEIPQTETHDSVE